MAKDETTMSRRVAVDGLREERRHRDDAHPPHQDRRGEHERHEARAGARRSAPGASSSIAAPNAKKDGRR